MSSNTPNLDLLKMDGVADGNKTFNIETMLNENWDKIDEAVGNMDFEVIDSFTSEDKTLPPAADALRRGLETKQNVVRLADNYKKASALPTEYPDGISFFKITGGVANGWPCDFGNVTTERTDSSATQMVKEVVTSSDTADKSARVFVRNKRDANAGWQPFDELTRATQLAAHAADAAKHSYWGGTTTGTGGATAALAYKATVADAQTTGSLPDGFTVSVRIGTANAAAEPMLQVNSTTALPIRRSPTAQFSVGSIKEDQLLSVVKVGSYFLARSAPPFGTATAAQVLEGATFQSEVVPYDGVGTAKENRAGRGGFNIPGYYLTSDRLIAAFNLRLNSHIVMTGDANSPGKFMITYDYRMKFFLRIGTTEVFLNIPPNGTIRQQLLLVSVDIISKVAYAQLGTQFYSTNLSNYDLSLIYGFYARTEVGVNGWLECAGVNYFA